MEGAVDFELDESGLHLPFGREPSGDVDVPSAAGVAFGRIIFVFAVLAFVFARIGVEFPFIAAQAGGHKAGITFLGHGEIGQ